LKTFNRINKTDNFDYINTTTTTTTTKNGTDGSSCNSYNTRLLDNISNTIQKSFLVPAYPNVRKCF